MDSGVSVNNGNNNNAYPIITLSEGDKEIKNIEHVVQPEYLNLCELVGQQQQQPSQDTGYLTEHHARKGYCVTIFMT